MTDTIDNEKEQLVNDLNFLIDDLEHIARRAEKLGIDTATIHGAVISLDEAIGELEESPEE